MSVLLAIAAVVTVAGALVAITGRDARIALIGLVVTMSAAPFLADPLPGPAALAARVVAALLGGYLLVVVLRQTTAVTRGSLVGLPAESLAAAAAFVIGYGTSGLGSVPLGPAAASATGFALAVIAVAPIVRGADVFRLGVALAVLVTGAELVRVGLAGTPPPLEQLMTAGLTIGLLGTAAVLCVNGVAATGGLALRNEPRRSALFEAHPITPTAASSLRPAWRQRRQSADRPAERPADAHRVDRPAQRTRPAPDPDAPAVPVAQVELWPPEAVGLADRPLAMPDADPGQVAPGADRGPELPSEGPVSGADKSADGPAPGTDGAALPTDGPALPTDDRGQPPTDDRPEPADDRAP